VIEVSAAAETDMDAADDWYAARSIEAAEGFRAALRETFLLIHRQPRAFARFSASVRRARVGHYPYGLLYVTEGTNVTVLACLHASRDPMVWRERARE